MKAETETMVGQVARQSKHPFSRSGWEHVHHCSTVGYDVTEVLISVWRLPVPGGWIYKVTEMADHHFPEKDGEGFYGEHRSVSVCFVPKVTVPE